MLRGQSLVVDGLLPRRTISSTRMLVQEHEVAYDEAVGLGVSPFVAILIHFGF